MEAAIAAFASSAAPAAATAAGAAGAAGTAMSLGSILSNGFTLLSTLGPLIGGGMQAQAGNLQAQQLNMQAEQNVMNARIEKVNAEEKALEIRRQLLSNISSANAIYASRGIGLGSGTPEKARNEATKNAELAIEKARFGGDLAANEKILQASQDRINAKAARTAGYASGFGTAMQAAPAISNLFKRRNSTRSLLDF